MTLVSIRDELSRARRQGYAVPLFDVFESAGVEGLMSALAARRAPTIIGVYGPQAAQENCPALAAYIRRRADDTDVPISLMLDHGNSVEQCLEMLDHGFTDVMYDGSGLSFEENVANTRTVVEAAHAVGAAVEAELGHVGEGADYDEASQGRSTYTDAGQVGRFVRETGVDFLAVAFGTAHGAYASSPRIDLSVVAAVHGEVDVPLVMHGGSGLSDRQFRDAIAAGISKINFVTDIVTLAADTMRATAGRPDSSMLEIADGMSSAYATHARRLYDVFGTANRA